MSLELRRIAHYDIVRKLGSGGMGEVFLARDTRLDRDVALKVLPENVSSDPRRLRRFLQEARIAAQLSHPNITHLYEIEQEGGLHYITMEFVEGVTLENRLRERSLSVAEVLSIGIQISDGLAEAHRKGIIHRDIKPSNIMIRESQAKILDFGLAKIHEESAGSVETKTESGAVLGTIQYMSPEQALGEEVDARSDLFSLGIVMYEMLSGRRPFSGAGPEGLLNQIVTASPTPLALPEGEAFLDLAQIIYKCLRKDRAERYQSAMDLSADLTRVRRLMSTGKLSSGEVPVHSLEFRIPRTSARTLFILLQAIYLIMYLASLRWSSGMETGLTNMLGSTIGENATWLLIAVAIIGIAVRLYLMSSVALDHVATGVRYRKAFPVYFLLDELWCLAPFGLSLKIGPLLALACVPALAFSPFSQRTLIRGAYNLDSPRRREA